MSILPVNEPHTPIDTPRNFFIYGATMSGKSYLAEHFPSPLFLNTDGNSLAQSAPAIQIRNIKNANGRGLKQSIITQLDEIIRALQNEHHTYETVVVDVIDDVCVMLEQAICADEGVQTLADIGYGKGFSMFNTVLQEMVMDLKALPLNVVYISRAITEGEGIQAHEIPSLRTKYYNIVNGNADLVIYTQRIGKRYIRKVTDRRKEYIREQIDDPKILRILDNVPGVYDKPVQTSIAEQNKIIKQQEEQQQTEGDK